jgi:hypothetical protein
MATRYNYTGGIVTNGLVLNLDAAKVDSYPGTGTTWRDLSGNNNNGTLINGPTFSGIGKQAAIVFDGVDDYVNDVGNVSAFSFIQNTGIFTISTWVKPAVLNKTHYFLGNTPTSVEKGFYYGFHSSNGLDFVIMRGNSGSPVLSFTAASFISTTDWVNITAVGNGSTVTLYKNGSSFQTSTGMSNFPTGDSTRVLNVGRITNFSPETFQGSISVSQIYNRPLSAAEVSQNFNALRGRYGI